MIETAEIVGDGVCMMWTDCCRVCTRLLRSLDILRVLEIRKAAKVRVF